MNPLDKENYKKAFLLFTEKGDSIRSGFAHPFRQKQNYCATDGTALIWMPATIIELDYLEQEKPDIGAVIPKNKTHNIVINIAELKAKLIPNMIDEELAEDVETKCKNCKRTGEIECDLGFSHDCVECDGFGTISSVYKKSTGNKIAFSGKIFKLYGVIFQYCQLKRLVDACEFTSVENITKEYGEGLEGNMFNCGEAKVLIMPVRYDTDDEVTTIF